MQHERDYSAYFLSSDDNDKDAELQLRDAHHHTDKSYYDLIVWPDKLIVKEEPLDTKDKFDKFLVAYRAMVWSRKVTVDECLIFYSNTISGLLDASVALIVLPSNGDLWPNVIAFQAMLRAEEASGAQMAIGASFHHDCVMDVFLHDWFIALEEVLYTYLKLSFDYDARVKDEYEETLDDGLSDLIEAMKVNITSTTFKKYCMSETAVWRHDENKRWLKEMLEFTMHIADVGKHSGHIIEDMLIQIEHKARNNMIVYCMIVIVFIGSCAVLGTWYAVSMFKMTGRMHAFANKISEKTAELKEEKKKTEKLLYQMLPKIIAERLKRNEEIKAEYYDCVTIYFSDIVGFTSISAKSSPHEVCELLNLLYR